ncbi:MAG: DUF45 domain-containing protein, partial [Clostridia bacterium]|nr:DUF45 domain-containing protein [Clostridia bacterium]
MASKATKTVRSISLGGRALSYECTRKKIKSINIRIRTDGTLCVSAPSFVPIREIEGVLKSKEDFILRSIARMAERKENSGADFSFEDGGILPFFGKEYVLRVTDEGSSRLDGNRLILSLRKTDDPKNRREAFKRFAEKELRAYALDCFARTLPLFAPEVSALPDLKLYTMRARWGSCRPRSAMITLNTR